MTYVRQVLSLVVNPTLLEQHANLVRFYFMLGVGLWSVGLGRSVVGQVGSFHGLTPLHQTTHIHPIQSPVTSSPRTWWRAPRPTSRPSPWAPTPTPRCVERVGRSADRRACVLNRMCVRVSRCMCGCINESMDRHSPAFGLTPQPQTLPSPLTRNQGIKAVRDEVAAFISQRDGVELPPADPEEVRCALFVWVVVY